MAVEDKKIMMEVGGKEKSVPAFLGGDSTIEPVFSKPGKVESYNVTFFS